jgi:hypothetical protein
VGPTATRSPLLSSPSFSFQCGRSSQRGPWFVRAQNKTLKGKKVDVPGQKNKKKIGEDATLTVGAMGLKIMDGPDVVASYLLQKLASWEATGNTLRIALDEKTWVEFTTDDGTEICEDILTIAKQLVTQKKVDEKERVEQKKALAEARREQGIRDFTVSQTFWNKKKKAKVPETVELNVSHDGIKITGAPSLALFAGLYPHVSHAHRLPLPQLRSTAYKRRLTRSQFRTLFPGKRSRIRTSSAFLSRSEHSSRSPASLASLILAPRRPRRSRPYSLRSRRSWLRRKRLIVRRRRRQSDWLRKKTHAWR